LSQWDTKYFIFPGTVISIFLFFEDGRGGGHIVNSEILRNIVNAAKPHGIELVFVSACKSRDVGEEFTKADVPHVIAIRRESIRDVSASLFARSFYFALGARKSIEQAFKLGKEEVGSSHLDIKDEKGKFLLLPERQTHPECLFADNPAGNWEDKSIPHPSAELRTTPEHFTGRGVKMHEVIGNVLEQRLVLIKGAPGIGKTALAIAVSNYMYERRLLKDSVFFVELKGIKTAEGLRALIAQALRMEVNDDRELFHAIGDKRCLFVLDNCENIFHDKPNKCRGF
jgi:hypothetical protein